MFDGKYLKKLRADNHYTQSKLALLLGVSRSTISMWEIGSSEPDNEALTKIAELFNVSIDSLLGRKFDNNIEPVSYTHRLKPLRLQSSRVRSDSSRIGNGALRLLLLYRRNLSQIVQAVAGALTSGPVSYTHLSNISLSSLSQR